MKENIKNYLKNNRVYGVMLLFASLCTVAFGGAYLGANLAFSNHEATAELEVPDDENRDCKIE